MRKPFSINTRRISRHIKRTDQQTSSRDNVGHYRQYIKSRRPTQNGRLLYKAICHTTDKCCGYPDYVQTTLLLIRIHRGILRRTSVIFISKQLSHCQVISGTILHSVGAQLQEHIVNEYKQYLVYKNSPCTADASSS